MRQIKHRVAPAGLGQTGEPTDVEPCCTQIRPTHWKAMALPRQPGLDPQLSLRIADPEGRVTGGVRPAHPAGYSCLVMWNDDDNRRSNNPSRNPWDAQSPTELRDRLAAAVPGLASFDHAEIERFLARRPGREHHIKVSPAFHDHSGRVALLGGALCWKIRPAGLGQPAHPTQRATQAPDHAQARLRLGQPWPISLMGENWPAMKCFFQHRRRGARYVLVALAGAGVRL